MGFTGHRAGRAAPQRGRRLQVRGGAALGDGSPCAPIAAMWARTTSSPPTATPARPAPGHEPARVALRGLPQPVLGADRHRHARHEGRRSGPGCSSSSRCAPARTASPPGNRAQVRRLRPTAWHLMHRIREPWRTTGSRRSAAWSWPTRRTSVDGSRTRTPASAPTKGAVRRRPRNRQDPVLSLIDATPARPDPRSCPT